MFSLHECKNRIIKVGEEIDNFWQWFGQYHFKEYERVSKKR